VRFRSIGVAFLILFAFSAGAARAQSNVFGVGASGGIVDAAEREFRFNEFHRSDVNAWLEYALEEQVVLRATLGRINVAAHNAGQSVHAGGVLLLAPDDLRDRIDYGLVSVSYDFVESAWKSGLFGGLGIYRVRPGNPGGVLAPAADAAETVWGLHVGLDAQVTVWRRLAVLGRVTVHVPQTSPHRVLVAADAGLGYRF
jgi:hypothetical protein